MLNFILAFCFFPFMIFFFSFFFYLQMVVSEDIGRQVLTYGERYGWRPDI